MSRLPLLLLVLGLILAIPASAQDIPLKKYTLLPDEAEESYVRATARVSVRTERPLVLYSVDYKAAGTPEEIARSFFRDRGMDLGMETGGNDMVLQAVRKTPGGTRVRFTQVVNGIPVYQSGVAITLDKEGTVRYVTNGYKANLHVDVFTSQTGDDEAISIAEAFLETDKAQYATREQVIYAPFGAGRLAHRVEMVTDKGSWEILVDAASGEVFRSEPTSHLRDIRTTNSASTPASAKPTPAPDLSAGVSRVDGSGWVFDPDPMSTAGVLYADASAFEDNNDADSPELTAQLRERTLRDISFDGTNFHLTGPYAAVADFDVPNRGLFAQVSSNFNFTRSHPAFEAVNTYFHLDQSMRYINETLGFELKPIQYEGGVQFDPHWGDQTVNAQYLFTGQLRFGEGGVDAAEDGEVVLHELGHGIHDWVTDGNLGVLHGLSEGSSDYWAASYTRSLGLWNEGDEGYDLVLHWGLQPFILSRTVDYSGNYPFDLTGAIHTDGQIWSSAVMSVWDELGKETTDLLFLEALSMLGWGSTTEDAARAIVLADTLLNGAVNAALVIDKMVDRGFIFRAAFAAIGRSGPPPRAVTFFDLSTFGAGSATAWEWDYESDGIVDNTSSLASFTYSTPGLHSVTLTASGDGRTQTTVLTDYISVNSGVYVWEGTGNTGSRSGRFIADLLQNAGVETHYSRTPIIHPSLEGFDAVFLSFGPSAPQDAPVPLTQIPARTIRDYLAAGGRVYLEGGDALGFDQTSNTQLLALFGVQFASDGDNENRPVTDLRGQDNSIATGRRFTSSQQTSVTFVDTFTPNSEGRPMFVEEDYGTVGVQAETSGGGRSVVLSYTLADLVDAESRRDQVLQDIVDFFGISAIITDTEQIELPESVTLSPIYPNPFNQTATLSFDLPQASSVRIEVMNTLGQRVAVLLDGEALSAGSHEVSLDSSRLPSGMYFVSLQAGNQVERMPVVLVR